MAQKITLDNNNKLVIHTDNGKIDGDNNQTTEIKGTFEIEAENVAILGALLNDMSFTKKEVYFKGDWLFTYNIITKDDKIKDLIKRLEDKDTELDFLKAKVEEHNARPFSRKIKLD